MASLSTSPISPGFPPVLVKNHVDHAPIVIVGGGIIGTATAYYLKKQAPRRRVIVVEKEAIACHSSGKAGGFLALGWSSGSTEALAQFSFRFHKELATTVFNSDSVSRSPGGGSPGGGTDESNSKASTSNDIDYRAMRCVGVGKGSAQLSWKGAPIRWLDSCAQTEGREMGNESNLAQVNPWKLTTKLMEASGAELMIGNVVGLEFGESSSDGGSGEKLSAGGRGSHGRSETHHSVTHVVVELEQQQVGGEPGKTNRISIECSQVLLAMGAWAQEARGWFDTCQSTTSTTPEAPEQDANRPGPPPIGSPEEQENKLPKPKFPVVLQSTVGHKYTSVIWDTVVDHTAIFVDDSNEVEIYPRVDEVYACGCPDHRDEIESRPCDIQPEKENVSTITEQATALSKGTLAGAPVKRTTSCYLPSSADGAPVLGKLPDLENAFVACGHTCWGILNGPATGLLMSEMMLQKSLSLDENLLEHFAPGRDVKAGCAQQ